MYAENNMIIKANDLFFSSCQFNSIQEIYLFCFNLNRTCKQESILSKTYSNLTDLAPWSCLVTVFGHLTRPDKLSC